MIGIESIEITDELIPMCDIEVEDIHCFYIGDVISHNSGEPVWLDAFINKQDPHKSTAYAMWGKENYTKDYRKLAKIINFAVLYGGCLRINTGVLTENGYQKIQNILGDVRVFNGEKFVNAVAFVSGKKDIYRLSFKDRSYIDLTNNHIVLIHDGNEIKEKKVEELEKGDMLIVPKTNFKEKSYKYNSLDLNEIRHTNKCKEFQFEGNDVELWWIVGLMMGDGWWNKGFSKTLNKKVLVGCSWVFHELDVEHKERLIQVLEKYNIKYNYTLKLAKNRNIPLHRVMVSNVAFANFINKTLGFSWEKDIPTELWTESNENIAAFIEGFFDADCTRDGRLIVTQNNERGYRRIRGIQLLLRQLGIISTYYKHPKRECHQLTVNNSLEFAKKVKFKWVKNIYEYSDTDKTYTQVVPYYFQKNIYEQIKKTEKYKKMTIEEKQKSLVYNLTHKETISMFSLKKIADMFGVSFLENFTLIKYEGKELIGKDEEVYDISVLNKDEKPYYVADGFLIHNSAFTLHQRTGIPIEDAKKFYNLFKQKLPVLFNWIDKVTRIGTQTGTVYTWFGRPRRVKFYLSHPDKKMRAFGSRTCSNTSVQGSASDIFKIALSRAYQTIGEVSKYKDLVSFKSMIHDELNLTVKRSHVFEVMPLLKSAMELKIPNWPITMEASLSVGYSWGHSFEFELEDGVWRPSYEVEVPHEEPKSILEAAENKDIVTVEKKQLIEGSEISIDDIKHILDNNVLDSVFEQTEEIYY